MFKNKKKVLFVLGLVICFCSILGISYAVWQLTKTQEGTNILTSGCFQITFNGVNDILLENAYPISDERGFALRPYTFTIKNECASKANYVINLETTSNGEKILSDEYVKANLQREGTSLFLDTLTVKNENVEKVIEEASNAYKLYQGVLKENEEISFDLRLWLDSETPTKEDVMKATYNGKITVTASYIPPANRKNMLMETNRADPFDYMASDFLRYTDKIVFQSTLNPIDGITPIDVSIDKTGTVLAYKDESDPDNIVTTIQANGKILFPENSHHLFARSNATTLEGLENVDTSNVTNMSYMFYDLNVTNLDVGAFDTSNVTNMSNMFFGMSSLMSLDVSHFETSNVTNMSGMFMGMSNLNSLDVSNFYTSNVTNMSYMFSGMSGLTSLDLSPFDTSNVTNMSYMFSGMSGLTSLDLSNFDTSKVTDMSYMFRNMTNLTTLDIHSFDTRNIKTEPWATPNGFASMFEDSSNLTTITYGPFFIYSNNASCVSMFQNCPANKPEDESWSSVTFS